MFWITTETERFATRTLFPVIRDAGWLTKREMVRDTGADPELVRDALRRLRDLRWVEKFTPSTRLSDRPAYRVVTTTDRESNIGLGVIERSGTRLVYMRQKRYDELVALEAEKQETTE